MVAFIVVGLVLLCFKYTKLAVLCFVIAATYIPF